MCSPCLHISTRQLVKNDSCSTTLYRIVKHPNHSDAMVVSFGTGKTVSAGGEGGANITDNLELYQKLVSICQYPHRQERDCGIGLSSELALNGRIHPIAAIIANETFENGLQELAQKRKVMIDVLDRQEPL